MIRGSVRTLWKVRRECRANGLRVAQLVANCARVNGYGDDPFYVEDDVLEDYCDGLYRARREKWLDELDDEFERDRGYP